MDMKWSIIIQAVLFIEDYIILRKKDLIQNLFLLLSICLILIYFLIGNEWINKLFYINLILNYLRNLSFIRILKNNKKYNIAVFHQFVVMISLALIIIFT